MGTFHFGLAFARHLPRGSKIATTSCGKNWFYYALPPPVFGTGFAHACSCLVTRLIFFFVCMTSKSTCLVCLALFIIAPDLQRIPAFNMAGEDWDKNIGKGKSTDAELRIAWDMSAKLLGVFVISHDRQTRLRRQYAKQLHVPCVFGDSVDLLPVQSDKRADKRERSRK
jgi:hypothetical protein